MIKCQIIISDEKGEAAASPIVLSRSFLVRN
jgi:hypothetical protein